MREKVIPLKITAAQAGRFGFNKKHPALIYECLFLFPASLSNIGQLFGSPLIGLVSGLLGRRAAILLLCLPLGMGWLLCGISEGNFFLLVAGRILQGVGIMSSVAQVYLVEMADKEHRYETEFFDLFGESIDNYLNESTNNIIKKIYT